MMFSAEIEAIYGMEELNNKRYMQYMKKGTFLKIKAF